MRKEIIIRQIGLVLLFNTFFLFLSFLISLYYHESSSIILLYSTLVTLIFGLFPMVFVPSTTHISLREGIWIVVFGWLITCFIGALPYILWGGEFSMVNAWFESVSGFTTTGSTILTDVEALPKGLLFWRSSTHWIGGVGVILFTILILPESDAARLVLLNTEMSELAKQNFRYRAKEVLQILAVVYVGLTLLETVLLVISGLSLFDAINNSFATIATGGFSTRNLSIASFHNVAAEIIIMVFMLISGIHFGLIFNTIAGKGNNIFKSSVVRAYVAVMLLGVIFVSLKLYFSGTFDFWSSLRYGSFQVISLGTTTGFATADSASWPYFAQMILIYFTIQCAMVGSTSGGLKFDRVYIFIKSIVKQIRLLQHPNAIVLLKVDGKSIDEKIENRVKAFIPLYLMVIFVSTLLLSAMNVDLFTAFSASIATIGNVGPGFAHVSSLGNFNSLPDLAKIILTGTMLLGRLEIFAIISVFFLRSWK